MNVEKLTIHPTYKKDNGLWALDTQNVLPEGVFTPVDQSIIWLPARQVAGNHKHERREALLGIGKAVHFLWQDDKGNVHEEAMNPDDTLYLFVIPPNVPHAVVNKSPTEPAILYEYFNDIHRGVERVSLVQELDGPQ
ncbi:MAG TPA: hypothetical protein VMR45_00955 [Patescibacteria group bacterium]|nr:hypothetical protein [Patescibacteria group bacterium]